MVVTASPSKATTTRTRTKPIVRPLCPGAYMLESAISFAFKRIEVLLAASSETHDAHCKNSRQGYRMRTPGRALQVRIGANTAEVVRSRPARATFTAPPARQSRNLDITCGPRLSWK